MPVRRRYPGHTEQRSRQRPGARSASAASTVEFLFLPGLDSVVTGELRDRLPGLGPVRPVPGRSDPLAASYTGEWTRSGPFDAIIADPPWGTLMGDHESNAALHTLLLKRAHAAAAPGARLAVLTHEIRIMENCLRQTAELWSQRAVLRVFQKGHNPRIYLLVKR